MIPPAWSDVRISPSDRSRIQAVGIDTAGRLQYRYHSRFVARQQRRKYQKVERFAEYLPRLRRRSNADIALPGLPRERVLAVVIRLINDLYFRLGTESSVRRYRTFGVTTLRNRHLEILPGGRLVFNFVGKHHIRHRRLLVEPELAAIMRQLKETGGARLFNYLDGDGQPHPIRPADVNRYIKSATAPEFSAKDFRTWGGTLLAALELADLGKPENERQAKKNIVHAAKRVAERLGNTPTVCRDCYIHPAVFEKYQEGISIEDFRPRGKRPIRHTQPDYEPEELALIKLFHCASSDA